MGGVQSLDRGEIVAFNLGPPAIASTPVEKLLGDTGVINVLKVPKVRNENWERAKPAFKPLLEATSIKRHMSSSSADLAMLEISIMSTP